LTAAEHGAGPGKACAPRTDIRRHALQRRRAGSTCASTGQKALISVYPACPHRRRPWYWYQHMSTLAAPCVTPVQKIYWYQHIRHHRYQLTRNTDISICRRLPRRRPKGTDISIPGMPAPAPALILISAYV